MRAVSFTLRVGYFILQLVISSRPRVAIEPTDCSRKARASSLSVNDNKVIFSLIGGILTGKLILAYLVGLARNLISFVGVSKMNLPSKSK